MQKFEELEKIQKLKENGTLTEEEFNIEKNKILNFDYANSKISKKNTWILPIIIVPIILIVIIILMISIIYFTMNDKNEKNSSDNSQEIIKYRAVYTNSKWTIINSNDEQLSNISYEEMIIIPNIEKPVFIITYDVDYANGTYRTKAVNEKNEQLFSQFDNISALENYDNGDVFYDENVLKIEESGKYGLIDLEGNIILEPEYEEITALQGAKGLVVIKKDGKNGLIRSSSKEKILDEKYTLIEPIGKTSYEGYIFTDEIGNEKTIDKNGQIK